MPTTFLEVPEGMTRELKHSKFKPKLASAAQRDNRTTAYILSRDGVYGLTFS